MTGAPLIPWSLPPVILRSDSNEESFIMHHDLRIKKAPCKALQRVFGVSNIIPFPRAFSHSDGRAGHKKTALNESGYIAV